MANIRVLKRVAALSVLTLVCMTGTASAVTHHESTNSFVVRLEPVLPEETIVATAIVASFEDGLESFLNEVFVDVSPTDIVKISKDSALEILDDFPVAVEATDALLDYAQSFADEAIAIQQNPETALTIDEVTVEQVGNVDVVRIDFETISVTADIKISRHIAEDNVDWTEVIPHEFVVQDGVVTDLVPHDLNYVQENASE